MRRQLANLEWFMDQQLRHGISISMNTYVSHGRLLSKERTLVSLISERQRSDAVARRRR